VPVFGQFVADRPVGVDDIVAGAVDQMEDYRAALDMAEEARAEPGAVAGAFDETRQIGQDKFLVVEPYHAKLGAQRGERIVGDLGPRVRDAREKR